MGKKKSKRSPKAAAKAKPSSNGHASAVELIAAGKKFLDVAGSPEEAVVIIKALS
jgi:hypothetical protein